MRQMEVRPRRGEQVNRIKPVCLVVNTLITTLTKALLPLFLKKTASSLTK